MSYSVEIKLPYNELSDALYNEQHSSPRSKVRLQSDRVLVTARDATALRAELNGLMRFLVVYEKLRNLIENGNERDRRR